MTTIFSARGEGRFVRNPLGEGIEFKARAEQTAGALTSFEFAPMAGEGPPLHLHENEDEVIYFVDGRFRVKIDGELRDAPAGSFVFIPKGVPHTWQNVDAVPGRLLVMFMPAAGGMERFFERFADVADDDSWADAFAALAGDAGMKVLGPPLAVSDPVARPQDPT
jgi:mannose-6-phosphate isomerase-like protein (cupin superfamily)